MAPRKSAPPRDAMPPSALSDEPLRIPRMGKRLFQIRDGAPFPVDLVRFHNARVHIDRIQEEAEDAENGAEIAAYIDLARQWGAPDDTSGAEAIALVNAVQQQLGELRDFFVGAPASPSTSDSVP